MDAATPLKRSSDDAGLESEKRPAPKISKARACACFSLFCSVLPALCFVPAISFPSPFPTLTWSRRRM